MFKSLDLRCPQKKVAVSFYRMNLGPKQPPFLRHLMESRKNKGSYAGFKVGYRLIYSSKSSQVVWEIEDIFTSKYGFCHYYVNVCRAKAL